MDGPPSRIAAVRVTPSASQPRRAGSEGLLTSLDVAPALGVNCFAGDLDIAATAVIDRALSGEGGYACLANVHSLVSAVHDPALRRALDEAWVVFPDGSPVAWVQRRAGIRGAAQRLRVPISWRGSSTSAKQRESVITSTAGLHTCSRHATRRLRDRFPDAIICGGGAPPFAEFDAPELASSVEAITTAAPHVVWCGLGMPKQELWMHRYAPGLAPALALGVGAAFDFLAGTKRRAPKAMQRLGPRVASPTRARNRAA